MNFDFLAHNMDMVLTKTPLDGSCWLWTVLGQASLPGIPKDSTVALRECLVDFMVSIVSLGSLTFWVALKLTICGPGFALYYTVEGHTVSHGYCLLIVSAIKLRGLSCLSITYNVLLV